MRFLLSVARGHGQVGTSLSEIFCVFLNHKCSVYCLLTHVSENDSNELNNRHVQIKHIPYFPFLC